MRGRFVLDASVTMAWLLADEADPYAVQVKEAISQGAIPVVPSLWFIETTHTVLRAERRLRITAAKALEIIGFLKALPVEIDPDQSRVAFTEGWALAKTHQLSAYDAIYLDLAIRRSLPIATLDEPFRAAARRESVLPFLT